MISNRMTTVDLGGPFSCRLYEDSRPHCLESAQLQKGLVLVVKGEEVVDEGMGFGVPVVIYDDEPYFSGTAECLVQNEGSSKVLAKSFSMDTVSRKRIGESSYVNDDLYSLVHKGFHKVYTQSSLLTPFLSKIIELTKAVGVNTEFVKVRSRGYVTVKYTCFSNSIDVEVSFNQLEKSNCKAIVILNEQGANIFRKYTDSEGLTLLDDKIGAWAPVKAAEASLSDSRGKLTFSLTKARNAVLFRGREKVRRRYSWVGLSYSLFPIRSVFEYTINLSANDRQ